MGRREAIMGRKSSGGGGGFSVVELMIVVVIVSVMATIAVPVFSGRERTDRVVAAATAVSNAFASARARALRTNAAHRIILHRAATDTTFNIRVDESPDTSCTGFDRIATDPLTPDAAESNPANPCGTWVASQQYRCGVVGVALTGENIAWGGYLETGVVLTAIQEEAGGAWTAQDDVVLCMNSRGRLLRQAGGLGWVPVVGGIRLTLDRYECRPPACSTPVGVTKIVYVPQGGIVEDLR
ncbi:MAG: prepilin-type N-terminal cleavage/methylation domain-containing protein [Deltaproteobacteria bacterium]|nr:prepilin-type N-terminal cleavage/methylation domain-containing protein [Deltaproteobacteria bacterium]